MAKKKLALNHKQKRTAEAIEHFNQCIDQNAAKSLITDDDLIYLVEAEVKIFERLDDATIGLAFMLDKHYHLPRLKKGAKQ